MSAQATSSRARSGVRPKLGPDLLLEALGAVRDTKGQPVVSRVRIALEHVSYDIAEISKHCDDVFVVQTLEALAARVECLAKFIEDDDPDPFEDAATAGPEAVASPKPKARSAKGSSR